ncbi:MAG: SDR family oxidoreductase [Ruminococcaceae bacterium]|nr:SDR family oxidoreductase [Oscillospiraceae bacterium]
MINQKVLVVTGASRGIGAEIAYQAALAGYYVVVNYNKSKESAEKVCERIKADGGDCVCIKADVSDETQVNSFYEQVMELCGRVDVLVNNAGISSFSLFTDISSELWDKTFDVNVKGQFLVTRAFLPSMIHRKEGRIINISSVWGICGSSCEVHYSASKAAIIGMTKALAKELGPSGICVNCVAPGVIDTDMNKALSPDDMKALADETPLCRIGTSFDVAKTVLFLASDDASFITGQVISPNGGFVI